VGAGLGGLWGLWKSYSDLNTSQPQSKDDSKYPNIKYDEFAQDSVNKFRVYQSYDPTSFDELLYNLDRMIGLQISVNDGKTNANFSHKATRYFYNIEAALKNLKHSLRYVPVPNLDTDAEEILQIADDYRNNITIDTNEFLMSHRSSDYTPPLH